MLAIKSFVVVSLTAIYFASFAMIRADHSVAKNPGPAEFNIAGPEGKLAGSLLDMDSANPAILIIPGSGPTDRNGNNPLGVSAASYQLLAEALAVKNISSLRIDKRGMFGSKDAVADPNKVTIADYVQDIRGWIAAIRKQSGRDCIWLLGHSEGGLMALAAAQEPKGICGVIAVAGPGRKMSDIMREQFKANPANAPILPDALRAVSRLEDGKRVNVSRMHPALQNIFARSVQDFMIDLFAVDPAELAAGVKLPLLIVQGDNDLQVRLSDAQALAAAGPNTALAIIPGMTHVLKLAPTNNLAANRETYADPTKPVASELVNVIATFVKR